MSAPGVWATGGTDSELLHTLVQYLDAAVVEEACLVNRVIHIRTRSRSEDVGSWPARCLPRGSHDVAAARADLAAAAAGREGQARRIGTTSAAAGCPAAGPVWRPRWW